MKLLVIGSGGREHALAWKLAASPRVQCVDVAPGNGGTARHPMLRNVDIAATDVAGLVRHAQAEKIALTVVGPEAALAAGVVDAFRDAGLRIVGPTRAAAQLESSKAFAKDFMARHGIPTAAYGVFEDAAAAHAFVDQHGAPIVVKADGLAAGKGVVVAMDAKTAHEAVDAMLGEAGARVVVEQFLEGEEASFIVLSDGRHVLPLASSQDHKRLRDGDEGPNTGGMGAYSPAPIVTPNVHARTMQEIIQPAIDGMAREGMPFTGFLYAGLMIDANGQPRTLEFNTRLGDPETQPLLMRLKGDLLDVLMACADGHLDQVELQWDRRTALGVVMAAPGYPHAPITGARIDGLPADAEDGVVFHAGTRADANGHLHASGGRVLCVTALGESPLRAQQRAYELLAPIHFDGMQFRRDIGQRAVERAARRRSSK